MGGSQSQPWYYGGAKAEESTTPHHLHPYPLVGVRDLGACCAVLVEEKEEKDLLTMKR